jgi:hypothetical protein
MVKVFKWYPVIVHCTLDRNKKFSSASKVVRLLFAQRFINIFNCRYHTSNHLSVCHKPTSLSPINCQSVDSCAGDINLPHDLPPTKKSSTIKSWPTFCDQYFWKFPIWNSCADEKRREIRMVTVLKWYPVIDLFDTGDKAFTWETPAKRGRVNRYE